MKPLLAILEGITEENQKGKMIAIPVEIGGDVPLSGENVEVDDRHITIGLMYGDEEENKKVDEILKSLCPRLKPFVIEIKELGNFPPNDSNHGKHVLWAKPQSDEINKLHKIIFKEFEKNEIKIDNGSFDFSPHITLKYCDQNPQKFLEKFNAKNKSIRFPVKRLRFAFEGNNKYYDLGR